MPAGARRAAQLTMSPSATRSCTTAVIVEGATDT
jgi:hypothetical protein